MDFIAYTASSVEEASAYAAKVAEKRESIDTGVFVLGVERENTETGARRYGLVVFYEKMTEALEQVLEETLPVENIWEPSEDDEKFFTSAAERITRAVANGTEGLLGIPVIKHDEDMSAEAILNALEDDGTGKSAIDKAEEVVKQLGLDISREYLEQSAKNFAKYGQEANRLVEKAVAKDNQWFESVERLQHDEVFLIASALLLHVPGAYIRIPNGERQLTGNAVLSLVMLALQRLEELS